MTEEKEVFHGGRSLLGLILFMIGGWLSIFADGVFFTVPYDAPYQYDPVMFFSGISFMLIGGLLLRCKEMIE